MKVAHDGGVIDHSANQLVTSVTRFGKFLAFDKLLRVYIFYIWHDSVPVLA